MLRTAVAAAKGRGLAVQITEDLPGHPEHRIVVRSIDGGFEVCEVVAVEDRTGDLPYLLAGIRLQRMDDPVRRSDALRRIHRIRKHLELPR